MHGLKVMNFQRFSTNLIQNSYLNSVWTRDWHVAWYYSPIPVWVDLDCELSDSNRSGHPRCTRTDSLKWIYLGHSIEIWWLKRNREKKGPHRLGFRRSPAWCGSGVDAGEAPVTCGRWWRNKGDQHGEAISGTWSPSSIVSRGERERRLEVVWRWCDSVRDPRRQSATRRSRRRASVVAPGWGEEGRREMEELGSPTAQDLAGDVCREVGLRWGIVSTSGHLRRERKREAREGSLGYL
jgi:hypothetical protein